MEIPYHLREGEFFKGYVRFISIGLFNSKYSIIENGSIIKVKNSTHVRCVLNSVGVYPKVTELPDSFEIIAPSAAVQLIRGNIPINYIQWLSTFEYLEKEAIYIG